MKESNLRDVPDQTNFPSSKRSYEDDDAQEDSCPMFKKRRLTDSLVSLSDQEVLETSITTTGPLEEDTPTVFNYTEAVTTNLSMEEEDVDDQLAEELYSQAECCSDDVHNPIPLLTPPGSPIPIKSEESVVEIYEWPCNLIVDNAFQSAIKLRALSPMSLAKLEDVNRSSSREDDFDIVSFRKVRTVTRDFLNCPPELPLF